MKTASFFTFTGPGRISIARYAPRATPAGFRVFAHLAPRRDMLRMRGEDYLVCYETILASLDPQRTWDKLHELAGGAEPVLLCWERPPLVKPDNWCHRRYVAEWFAETLGVTVEEHTP